MNLLDYIIIITLIYLIVKGILRGFIREFFSFAGIVLGIWLGNLFQPQMTDFFRSYLPSSQYLPVIGFAVLFAAILGLCNIIGWIIKLLFKKALMGWMDSRVLGACLGFVKGIIITYIAIIIVTFFIPAKTPLIAESKLTPWIIKSYQSMVSLISPGHYQKWKRKIVGEQKKIGEIVSEKIKDMVNNNE